MPKWADYLIAAVQFNPNRAHINRLRLAQDKGESIGSFQDYDRQQVVAAIKSGTTFVTIYKNGEDKWNQGKQVFVVPINGNEYLKTVADNKLIDNLDNLPEF
ncbi:hypothetical protein MAFF211520_04340 [Ralstonia pseudosolanacearum]|uniref:DUF3892 domain-containing protein n=2 Tax=Ralstonia pseudosolanacearum TaxID=1310165 RepID=UPI0009B78368|nr:DUF3892 domain-containing protein [Ralstonia pseudosolanacearum]NKF77659.1 hypothetical protein [Ralstonia solanacearum]QKZ26574.1 DUF3892 domain-containing protein [Ralstonia solanacearum]QKZ31559.1 DUF3892 domain-containing protein [Ralstonia solanacearum]QMT11003.1 DUF3892 domain-containing protein [Ralstonia solanacearum]BEU50142.1 hypothetical protein MAFF211520_04340 [Ralstonia pseudosolanacearum]